jgi:hypothetical protein
MLHDTAPKSSPAELWPSTDEIDGFFWAPTDDLGPDPLDAAWASLSFGSDSDDDAFAACFDEDACREWAALADELAARDDDDIALADELAAGVLDDDDGPLDESRAIESAAMDLIEASLIPNDVAEAISRTSLVGPDDSAVDAVEVYRSTVSRLSGRGISTEQARLELGLAWLRESVRR